MLETKVKTAQLNLLYTFSSTVCFYRNGNRSTLYLVLYILICPLKNNLIKINEDVTARDTVHISPQP